MCMRVAGRDEPCILTTSHSQRVPSAGLWRGEPVLDKERCAAVAGKVRGENAPVKNNKIACRRAKSKETLGIPLKSLG